MEIKEVKRINQIVELKLVARVLFKSNTQCATFSFALAFWLRNIKTFTLLTSLMLSFLEEFSLRIATIEWGHVKMLTLSRLMDAVSFLWQPLFI